jgi:hypothetical protein
MNEQLDSQKTMPADAAVTNVSDRLVNENQLKEDHTMNDASKSFEYADFPKRPWFRCPGQLIEDFTWSRLRGLERAVLLVVISFASRNGVAWPAVSTIAKYAGVTRRSVQRGLKRLVRRGVLKRLDGWSHLRTRKYLVLAIVRVPQDAGGRTVRASKGVPPDAQTEFKQKNTTTAVAAENGVPMKSAWRDVARTLELSDADVDRLLALYGLERLSAAVAWTARRKAANKLNSPLGFLHAALARGYKIPNHDARLSANSGFKAELPGAKEARERRELERLRKDGEAVRPLLAKLALERLQVLRLEVLNDSRYAKMRPIFEVIDPLAGDSADAIKLALLMWRRACEKGWQ